MITIWDYHNDTTHISKSGLDLVAIDPFLYYAKKINPSVAPTHVRQEWARKDEKRHFILGDAFDRYLLEPDEFWNEFAIIPKPDMRTSAGKISISSTLANNPGKRLLWKEEMELIEAMFKSVLSNPVAANLLKGNIVAQQTICWIDPLTGIKCKCRPDFANLSHRVVCDIKTIDGLSRWIKHVLDFRYDVQDSFYSEGIDRADPWGIDMDFFVFIVVDTNWPHNVLVEILPKDAKDLARLTWQKDLQTYQRCLETGIWRTQQKLITETKLPPWHFVKRENNL